MNYHNLSKENEKNFTLSKNNDTIKLQNGAEKLGKTAKQNSPEIKTILCKRIIGFERRIINERVGKRN